jgi:phytoene dehydrogenase-like protein
MPAHCWGTPDQIDFLTSHLPNFQDAQRTKTTSAFWGDFYREFFKRWPEPSAEVPPITVTQKSRSKKGKQHARKEYDSVAEWTDDRKNVSRLLY